MTPRLSLVLVAYDMHVQLARTLRSLSRSMQRGIAADDVELIVVDNASPEPLVPVTSAEHGGPLRWLRLDDAPASPAQAVNRGLSLASAALVGVMVDGARIVSPGLLRTAISAAALAERPVIGTLGFHIGPDLQQHSTRAGYDEAAEARLLDGAGWERDGYRLFDVSVLAASSTRGWFHPPSESNALFMPAEMWHELGGYDEDFTSAGGGFVNLDTFARACALPDSELIMLLGEATFHQVHGGISTNRPDPPMAAWQDEYMRLRGRPYRLPDVRPMLVGTPPPGLAGSPSLLALGRTNATRFLELLKMALLNETGLEAEAAYLLARDALDDRAAFDDAATYDIRNRAAEQYERVRQARHEGTYVDRLPTRIGFSHTMIGRPRLDNLHECVTCALLENVPGDLVECGVWRGGATILMRGILAAHGIVDRTVWVADSFAGVPGPESPRDTLDLSAAQRPELVVSQERVAEAFARFGLLDDQVRFLPGWFKDTLPSAPIDAIAVLRLDGDLFESTMTSLIALYDRVSPGGFVIVDDYGCLPACREAVDEFRTIRGITDPISWIDWTGIYWRKAR